jgi:hypothetical protein
MKISRIAKFVIFLASSVALHVLGWQWMSARQPARLPSSAAVLAQIRFIELPRFNPSATQALNAASVVAVPTKPISPKEYTPANLANWLPPIDADPRPDPTELDVLQAGTALVENFYPSSEVDTPATPETDWPVGPIEGIPNGATTRFRALTFQATFTVWVDSNGRIERIDVMEVLPESQKIKASLEAMVGQTVKPAMLGGLAVANQRVIKMWITQ